MRFDELVVKVPGDEIRVPFHPRMTVLSGLGTCEREALAGTIVGALTGGPEETALRFVDGAGRTVILLSEGGGVQARHDDGSGPAPFRLLGASPEALRHLILLRADDVSLTAEPAALADEPPELREARASLHEVTQQLEQAVGEAREATALQAQLDAVEEQLRTVDDSMARAAYAKILAEIARLRAESALGADGPEGVAADQRLLAGHQSIEALAVRWTAASTRLTEALEHFGTDARLAPSELVEAARIAASLPADVMALADAVVAAEADRDALEGRLEVLTDGRLPAPSDPLVEVLGVVDDDLLWPAAARVVATGDEEHRVRLALGGLGPTRDGDEPPEINDMEAAHRDLEAAEQAAEAIRVPGVAGSGFGLAVALAGAVGAPMLIPFGLLITAVVGTITLLIPRRRVAGAAAVERAALDVTGAPSYLGFHLRRVNATMDPRLRKTAGMAAADHRAALAAWVALAGPGVEVELALAIEAEVRAYHEALRRLSGDTEEIEQIRRELVGRSLPAVARSRAELTGACAAVGVPTSDADDPSSVAARVTQAIDRGYAARRQLDVEAAESAERDASAALSSSLDLLEVAAGPQAERLRVLEAQAEEAHHRQEARRAARPLEQIDADLSRCQQEADRLRRPEWADVSEADADLPSAEELGLRQVELRQAVAAARPSVDVNRLADRHAALERRVGSLVARRDGDLTGDPTLVADIQQLLVDRLTRAAKAGPDGDPLPAVLDEVLDHVPVDRKWDLLDQLYGLSEHHQIVYLSDDPFVAAWARQLANGTVSLLEPETESV